MAGPVTVRRLFPGGNTPQGFYSFYDQILPQDQARGIVILKGGPGSGKSTFMKHIGQTMEGHGLDVEYHHCSADPGSVDALVVPAAGMAVMDGTAPHVVDPKTPGAVEQIVNLGDCWDIAALEGHRGEITSLQAQAGMCYNSAYRYLSAARRIYDDLEAVNGIGLDTGWLNQQAQRLVQEICGQRSIAPVPGHIRHLFGSAITPEGLLNHLDTVVGGTGRTIVLRGEPGTGKATMLQRAAAACTEAGLDVEAFHCPFDPSKLEHLLVPGVDVWVTTSTYPHTWERPADLAVDTAAAVSETHRTPYMAMARAAREEYVRLMETAMGRLEEAKRLHKSMEEFYVPHVDFSRIDALREGITQRILEHVEVRDPA